MRQLGHEGGAFLAELSLEHGCLDGDPARGDIARQVPGGPPQMARSRTSQWTRLATSSRSTSSALFGIDVIVIKPGGIRSEWAGIAADKPMIFPHDVLSDRTFDVVMRRVTGVPSNWPAAWRSEKGG
jgi:hypothetical protein